MPSSCAGAAQGGVQNGAKGSVQGLGKSSSSCSCLRLQNRTCVLLLF